MSEIEKMKRYIERTKMDCSFRSRFPTGLSLVEAETKNPYKESIFKK